MHRIATAGAARHRIATAPARRWAMRGSVLATVTAVLAGGAAARYGSPPPPRACLESDADCFAPHDGTGCNWLPCCTRICEIDALCCNLVWDAFCAEAAQVLCDPPPACFTGVGDCFVPQAGPACGDEPCCYYICAIDPFCCLGRWDAVCAESARRLCATLDTCRLPPTTGELEQEACQAGSNDGCAENAFAPVQTLRPGTRIRGQVHAVIRRDTDWYALDLGAPTRLEVTLESEFPAELSIVAGTCEEGYEVLAVAHAVPCSMLTLHADIGADLAPGRILVVVGPGSGIGGIYDGIPCASRPPDWGPHIGRAYELGTRLRPPTGP